MDKETILTVKNISVRYGGIQALDNVSITLNEGEVVALMGPNGAGKSTVLKAIFGLSPIHTGEIIWCGQACKPVPHQMVRKGIALVPQGRRVFTGLTVEENLEIGGNIVGDARETKKRIKDVMNMFPVLREKRNMPSGILSGGQQQMLAIARGLMTDPKALLLDEPSLGLAPKIVKEVFKKIKEIHENRKTAVMIVEHNIQSLLKIADRAYVLDKGKLAATDSAKNILKSGVVEKVFLGE